ncbi:MAG TPA: response regulator [Polyangiaceae bacterium]
MSRVLVVEDYPPLATVLAIGVGRLGHEVVRVGSAQRARAAEGEFDCAIVDIDLPDGCGVDLAEELLSSKRAAAIVFYTATRDQSLRSRGRALGTVVDKSEPLQGLLDVMTDWFAGQQRARAVGEQEPAAVPVGRSGLRQRVR